MEDASMPEVTMARSAGGVNCSRVTCEADLAKLSSPSVHRASLSRHRPTLLTRSGYTSTASEPEVPGK